MKPSLADVGFACAAILLAVFVLLQAGGMESSSTFAKVPPNIFPLIVGAGLLVVGVWLLYNALRGEKAEPAAEEDADPNAPTNYAAIAFVGGGFLIQILLINILGFVLTSSLLFASTAQGFRPLAPQARAKAFGWDFLIGIVLSLVTYLGFTRGLGLQLPAGILGF
ncbi:MAG: tripartite tricarboxylate transporter TctB family protein [Deinococcales bacterium]